MGLWSANSNPSSKISPWFTIIVQFVVLVKTAEIGIIPTWHKHDMVGLRIGPTNLWTPEDIRYAEERCQNDSGFNVESALRDLWANKTYPDDHETHCYIKCFLEKLGLIHLVNRGLDSEKLYQFWENIEEDFSDDCLTNVNLDEWLSGTCQSYYKKWMTLTRSCRQLVDFLMFAYPDTVYRYPPYSKPFAQTAVEFCDAEKDDASEVSSQSADVPFVLSFKCRLHCIFKHFRYFDGYGRLDEVEILRSFKEAHELTSQNKAAVRSCTHTANALLPFGRCDMANELYSCLKKSSKDFTSVYLLRDKLTQKY